MRAGRIERRDEDGVGSRPPRATRLGDIMDRHRDQQPVPASLRCPIGVALTQVDAIGAPAPRHIGRSCKQDDEPSRPRGAHQPPEQAPTPPGRQPVVPEYDTAAGR